MIPMPFTIRAIETRDDPLVAAIIRGVMTEFGCTGQGYAIHDPEVAAMTAAYDRPGAEFYVVVDGAEVRGCGGFSRLAGTTDDDATCELQKMYFLPELRGRGAGRALLEMLLERMRGHGYRRCYLETTAQMEVARTLYRRLGFEEIPGPLGATGHHGCDRFFIRRI